MNNDAVRILDTGAQAVSNYFDEVESLPYTRLQIEVKNGLKSMFERYKVLNSSTREKIDQLMNGHKDYCIKENKDTFIRQHDVFVLKYVTGLTDREIAQQQNIALRTVYKDIDHVFNYILIMLLGFYGIRWY